MRPKFSDLSSKMLAAKNTLSRSRSGLHDHTRDKHEEFSALAGSAVKNASASSAKGTSKASSSYSSEVVSRNDGFVSANPGDDAAASILRYSKIILPHSLRAPLQVHL